MDSTLADGVLAVKMADHEFRSVIGRALPSMVSWIY
jgi:hypothetical protein